MMKTTIDIVRAWKDPEYRASLSSEELNQLPAMPIEDALSELDSALVTGGQYNPSQGFWCTLSSESGGCCNPFYTLWK